MAVLRRVNITAAKAEVTVAVLVMHLKAMRLAMSDILDHCFCSQHVACLAWLHVFVAAMLSVTERQRSCARMRYLLQQCVEGK